MRVILVRHGETNSNKEKISQGWSDIPLSKEGIAQAKKVAERLKEEKIDLIISSDSSRASKTAEEINKFHNKEAIKTKLLREQGKGIYEGKPNAVIREKIESVGATFEEFVPEGGESLFMTRDRVVDFFNKMELEYFGKTVLIVSHGAPISLLCRHLNDDWKGDSWKKYQHDNTGVTYLEKKGNKWEITKLNDTSHFE